MINVDLLIADPSLGVLLTWRDDEFYGPGWHIPGGVIRFKETASHRIHEVAKHELGSTVEHQNQPLTVREMFHPTRDARGHFISLLYACRLTSELPENHQFLPQHPVNGAWSWHQACPCNLIFQHATYKPWIERACTKADRC